MAIKNMIAGGIGFSPGTPNYIFTRGLGFFAAAGAFLRRRMMFSKVFIGKIP